MKDYPHVQHWGILHVETYCTLNWNFSSKSGKWVYVMDDDHDFEHMKKEPNPQYDPNAKPDRYPKKCTREINIGCIKCKHAAFCEYTGDEEEEGLK
jgi:hypothetical protein